MNEWIVLLVALILITFIFPKSNVNSFRTMAILKISKLNWKDRQIVAIQ